MDALLQEIRFATRHLTRAPGFVAVAVATLAFGIGANVSIFSLVSGTVLRPLPFEGGDELVVIRQVSPLSHAHEMGISVPELADYREANRTLAGVVEYHSLWFTLFDRGIPERVQSGVVSWDFFHVLGVQPLHGRLFLPHEDVQGAEPVLVLGHDFWQTHFGGDPGVIGRPLEMNDHVHTVVGVLPPLPAYPGHNDVWMPWYACPFRTGENWLGNRGWRSLQVIGRLSPGTAVGRAGEDVAAVAHRMRDDHPEAYSDHPGFGATLTPLREELSREARPVFLLLMGMSGFVLLIACANVANLTLARMSRREHELAICSALGANRARLTRRVLVESTFIAMAGGALGILLAAQMSDLVATFAVRFTPRGSEVRMDGGVLLFAVAASVMAGLVTGGITAQLFVRRAERSIRGESRNTTAGTTGRRARNILVTAQIAITFVLLVGSGLAIRSFAKLHQVDPGFDPENVLTMQFSLDWTRYADPTARRTFYREVLEGVGDLPESESASLAGSIPLGGGVPQGPIQIEGRPVDDGRTTGTQVDFQLASHGYFETLGIPLVQGRTFDADDRAEALPVAIISRSMARRLWGEESPLGARISDDGENWATIVGVVGDVKQERLELEFRDQAYVPLDQNAPLNANLLVRTRGDPSSVAPAATAVIRSVDPRQPVSFVRTLRDVRDESIASSRLTALLLGLFGALALTISVAGVAGVVAFTVGERIPEIGVRMALGATRRHVLYVVVRECVILIALGLALGIVAAAALARLIAGWLYDVPVHDPLTLLGAGLVLVTAALVAAFLPAFRATRVQPVIALAAT